MLQAVLWSLIGALIYAGLTMVISFIFCKKDEVKIRKKLLIIWGIVCFCTDFITMTLLLYSICTEQTIFAVAKLMWIPLLINFFILLTALCIAAFNEGYNYYNDSDDTCYQNGSCASTAILLGCSIIFTVISLVVEPVQNMVYVHDMKNVDITYAVSSDEVLAKVTLNIDNSVYGKDKYGVDDPEMIQVGEKSVAVYHIYSTAFNATDYIPGYAIQEKGKLPQIVSKRIYYDTSYAFGRDALRTVRRKYPTVVITGHKFDIDDEWNPYEVFAYREKRYSTDGKDYGLIILNLMDGTCEKYPVSENNIPTWVDFKTTYPR